MDDAEAQRQINQMVNFILNEAKDKAQEIDAKAMEDFNIEKLKMVQKMKDKIRQEYAKKAKQVEVERSIARSTAVNRARLKKIAARNAVLTDVTSSATARLADVSKDTNKYKIIITDLIVQGLVRLLEDEVVLQCRQADKSLVEGLLSEASSRYSTFLQKEAGVKKSVKLSIDNSSFLPPPPTGKDTGRTCCGGVILMTPDQKIVLDNTLDKRLQLIVEECKPEIRKTLFPSEKAH
eukprot:Platyproteum_vivax@DN5789_c0_g1_i2.p1